MKLIYYSLLILLFSCKSKPSPVEWKTSHYSLTDEISDSILSTSIKTYKLSLDKEMNEILVVSEDTLTKGQPEGNLGNFVADCLLEKAKEYYSTIGIEPDLVILNNGGLRSSLPKGEVTRGKIFELMPFDNTMVLAFLKGNKTLELMNFIAQKGGVPVSGIKMKIDSNKKITSIKINEEPLDTNKIYHVVSSDYLIQGGDNINFFKTSEKKYSNILIRDILIEHCKKLGLEGNKISIKKDGRISISE